MILNPKRGSKTAAKLNAFYFYLRKFDFGCEERNKDLAMQFRCSVRTIQNWLETLGSRGLIEIHEEAGSFRQIMAFEYKGGMQKQTCTPHEKTEKISPPIYISSCTNNRNYVSIKESTNSTLEIQEEKRQEEKAASQKPAILVPIPASKPSIAPPLPVQPTQRELSDMEHILLLAAAFQSGSTNTYFTWNELSQVASHRFAQAVATRTGISVADATHRIEHITHWHTFGTGRDYENKKKDIARKNGVQRNLQGWMHWIAKSWNDQLYVATHRSDGRYKAVSQRQSYLNANCPKRQEEGVGGAAQS